MKTTLSYPKQVRTKDGSDTLFIEDLNEHYHSIHGAITESKHVFIKEGFLQFNSKSYIKILEVGFGTGLNALLTLKESRKRNIKVDYTGIEPFPLKNDTIKSLGYAELLNDPSVSSAYFSWFSGKDNFQSIDFYLEILMERIQDIQLSSGFNCVYYDAFAPSVQPEMWNKDIFRKIFKAIAPGGIIVTYCAQGAFKRTLKEAGFNVQTILGPPGKREMVRGVKIL